MADHQHSTRNLLHNTRGTTYKLKTVDNTKNSTIHYVPVQAPLTAMYTLTSTPVNGVITASATDHKMDASVDRLSIYISTSENYYIVNSYCVLYNTYLCRDWRIRSSTIKFFV